MNMEPARYVIAKFGGIRPLARKLGPFMAHRDTIEPSTIERWQRGKPRGTNGLIPAHYHAPLLELARAEGVPLSAEELIFGSQAGDAGQAAA